MKKRVIGGRTYYYLEHSLRVKGKVEKKETYLGKALPKNVEEIKRDFLRSIYEEKWFKTFDSIRRNFAEERRLMPKSAGEEELRKFSIRFTYDTQRIEGSALTLRETANLLEMGVTPLGKPVQDIKEAEAHEKILYEILRFHKDLSLKTILYWHKRLFESTKKDITGRIRRHQVAISGSKFVPPSHAEIYPLLRELFKWYERNRKKLHPVELAGLVHLKFVTIHPFADGNGRISRLIMNFILAKRSFPMLNVPYMKRNSYYNALDRSQVKRQDSIFLQWFFKRYVKEYRRYV
ncbi:MAG TPA: Fic family protein [Candidatus Hodarchaeales archaeon]|nr:Fic family protein [Candidatus Hodarchaeales archaeon]